MFDNFRISQRFIAVLMAYWVSFMAVAGASFWGLVSARDSMRYLHDSVMVATQDMTQAIDAVTQSRLQVLLAFQHAPDSALAKVHDHPVALHLDGIAKSAQTGADLLAKLDAQLSDGPGKARLAAAKAAYAAWVDKLGQAQKSITSNDLGAGAMAAFLQAGRTEAEAATQAL